MNHFRILSENSYSGGSTKLSKKRLMLFLSTMKRGRNSELKLWILGESVCG